MTTSKTTNKTAIQFAIDNLPNAPVEIREKWANMIAQLDKKNAAPKKLTAKQEQNEVTKVAILNFLADNEGTGYTCGDLIKTMPELAGDSNQHVSALLRALVLAGSVNKYTDKRRTYFRVGGEG